MIKLADVNIGDRIVYRGAEWSVTVLRSIPAPGVSIEKGGAFGGSKDKSFIPAYYIEDYYQLIEAEWPAVSEAKAKDMYKAAQALCDATERYQLAVADFHNAQADVSHKLEIKNTLSFIRSCYPSMSKLVREAKVWMSHYDMNHRETLRGTSTTKTLEDLF